MAPQAPHIATGQAGESAATAWLERKGFRVADRNWRTRVGELDIVAWDGRTLVFVEVKTRRGPAYGTGAEAVDARKRARMTRAADAYLSRFGRNPPECRFDVIEVDVAEGGAPAVSHLPDAFRPGW